MSLSFESIIGNTPAKHLIQKMLAARTLPNTILFAGPDGIGKGALALATASVLMGEKHTGKIISGNHPDLHIYKPEGKTGQHSVASMRQLIEEIHLPPFEAPVKVFILHDAERMLPAASNALLKTFEEPTLNSFIFLLSSAPQQLLPTIVSRCRKIPFSPIPEEAMIHYLIRTKNKTSEEALRIAFLSQGSMSKAEELCLETQNESRQILLQILAQNPSYVELSLLLAKLEEKVQSSAIDQEEGLSSIKAVDALLEEIFYWYRDLHLLACGGNSSLMFHQGLENELKEALKRPLISLEKVFELLSECRLGLQRNMKLRVCLENFFLKSF